MRLKRHNTTWVFYPALIAAFPVLFLYSRTPQHYFFGLLLSSFTLLLGGTALVWLLLWLLNRDVYRAALATGIVLLWLLAFGHVYHVVPHYRIDRIPGMKAVVFMLWTGAAAYAIWQVLKLKKVPETLTRGLNMFSVILLFIPLLSIAKSVLAPAQEYRIPDLPVVVEHNAAHRPDIYYIILDGCARHDVLLDLYSYDDSWFIDSLVSLGFHVCRSSRANYGQTMMSLASSLNLSFVDSLVSESERAIQDRRPLRSLVADNAVFRNLKARGYHTSAVASGYTGTEYPHVDENVTPVLSVTEFDETLWSTTGLAQILDLVYPAWQHELNRERVLFSFEHIASLPNGNSPVFRFAHIVAPHPPFVFGKDGEMLPVNGRLRYDDGGPFAGSTAQALYVHRYREQMEYIEKLTVEAVRTILRSSSAPPIIIIQGDHGPGSHLDWDTPEKTNLQERLSILNALYTPPADSVSIPDDLTPVNTFRIIFNKYFGAGLPLLPNRSLFSTWLKPYTYTGSIQ